MVKGNAHGHGSVPVAKFLETHGIRHFAVATVLEGEELRQAGIRGFILIFGTILFISPFSEDRCSARTNV